jgi:RNA polymerase sigma-70 factor (ECF subfamily)
VSVRDDELKMLFLRAKKGDEQAYRLFLESVEKTMNPRFRSMEKVEDLVQEVLISIHRKRDLYSEEMPILPWVYAISRYRLIDSLRHDARRPDCVEWIEKFDAQAFVEMPKLLEEEDGHELMQGLNAHQQEIFKLAKVDELSLGEIAEQKGMSVSAIKVSIHRSLKTMRKNFGMKR